MTAGSQSVLMVQFGVGNPNGVVTPLFVGALYLDQTEDAVAIYQAQDLTDSNWTLQSGGGGGGAPILFGDGEPNTANPTAAAFTGQMYVDTSGGTGTWIAAYTDLDDRWVPFASMTNTGVGGVVIVPNGPGDFSIIISALTAGQTVSLVSGGGGGLTVTDDGVSIGMNGSQVMLFVANGGTTFNSLFLNPGNPNGVVTSTNIGDWCVDSVTPGIWQATAPESNSNWVKIGGPPAGVQITRAFPFTFDTPDLATGAALYTPTPGDILHDAWIEIDTAWDGTTPKGDIWSSEFGGFFDNVSGITLDMTQADEDDGNILLGLVASSLYGLNLLTTVKSLLTPTTFAQTSWTTPRWVPFKFNDADPIGVVVSQDGTTSGGDPGSTQGSAILYLVTSTPA